MFERKTMSAEGQHERQQRIGHTKCQKAGGASVVSGASVGEQRSGIAGNTVNDELTATRHHVVETRRIKKERHYADGNNDENGTGVGNIVAISGETTVATAASENGHQNSRSNSSCRTNGFHPSDMLQEIIAAKFGQTSTGGHANGNKNDKIRLMIEDSLSEDSKNRVQEIFLQVEQLKIEEKLLLYLRLPASLANPGGAVDPLRQPLNPLGNRYEIHQTIMWIKTHLEEDPDVSLPKQEVYDEYNVFCIRNAMKPLSTADFGKVMKQVYPRVRPRRLGTRGNSRYCYAGMRKRVKLDTPTLPCVTESATTEDFDETITEEMLGAASIIIREWAESLLKMKFSSLSALARHLVENLRVDTRSLSAVCILSATGDSQASSNTKETSPSLSVTPVAGKPPKLREAQLQLQRKLQQREHTRDQKNRQGDPAMPISVKEKPAEVQNATTAAAPTTTTTTTTTGRSSSSGKNGKKSKTSQSPQIVAPAVAIVNNATAPAKSEIKPIASSPAPTSRSRKLPRSTQASNSGSTAASPQCEDTLPVNAIATSLQQHQHQQQHPRDSAISREVKTTTKNPRKRSSHEAANRQTIGESSSPEKQAKLTEVETIEDEQQRSLKNFAQVPAVQRVVERVTLVVPSVVDGKNADKSDAIESRLTRKSRESEETSLMEKMTNGRANVWESIAVSRLEDKLCTIDPDALDDYLNGGNNSQEQEEELLQYFQQSNSSSDIEASFGQTSAVGNCENAESASRSDKVSQLRLILQQNLKAAGGVGGRAIGTETSTPSFRRTTPVAVVSAVAEAKTRENRAKQHDIVLPILLNHAPSIGATRRRVSFETSVTEQQQQQQQQQQHHHHQPEMTSQQQLTMLQQQGPINTVPQSPNTRRRIFNFTPISPGPHSPINGRAASASKPNSANASPFVSPRNTPVPRSRSNLQSNAAALCRVHRAASQKTLVRSISCSVPYSGASTRQETFVVPTSGNSESARLPQNPGARTNIDAQSGNVQPPVGRAILTERHPGEEAKILDNGPVAAAAASFLNDLDNQRQLIINYPSQENLQEIKNVYGGGSLPPTASNPTTRNGATSTTIGRSCQPAADREISELLNGAGRQHGYPTSEQLYYRSQSVPLHRMVNPTLMSPISSNSQFCHNQSFNNSSSSSIAPTPVPSEFNDFVSIGAHEAYLLDEVDAGFIADEQQFLMEDKESITKILNILDEEGRQSMTILPERANDADSLMENTNLTIDLLEPLPNGDITLRDDNIIGTTRVDSDLGKIIESKSYPNTPLPVGSATYRASGYVNNDDNNSNGSRSYPTTPLNALNSRDIYRESNEPMLSSPTLNSLNLRGDNVDSVNDGVICRNVTDLLESNFSLGDETDNDDLDPLGNFDGLQDVDSLTPLFNEVTEANR